VTNGRLMQPPQNGALPQGIRQTTPQQQHQLPSQTGLRGTPPRPVALSSPTTGHFLGGSSLTLQNVLQMIQQNNPHLSVADATKLALDHLPRFQQQQQESLRNLTANGTMPQHLQQMVKASPTQGTQQVRRSPSNPPVPQSQQRM
jgi:hypothetical protein